MSTKSNPVTEALAVAGGRKPIEATAQPDAHAASVKRIVPPGRFWTLNLKELAGYRELLYFLVWREIKVRYKQTVIGAGWAVIQPVATMLVFTLFFGRLARIPSGGLPYPLFFYSALLPWTYFAGALSGATNSVVENQRVITKVYFPRLLLPLSAVFSGLVDFVIAFVLLAGMALYYRVTPGPWLIFLPVFLLLAMFTAFGAGLWLAALNALYRDVRYVVPFLIQFWLFASPVAYPSTLVPERWRALYGLNPMAGVIDGFRWAVSGENPPSPGLVAASAGAVIVMLVAGLWYFRRVEATVADVV
ncbi:MAG TPA: ABC transporter permease [Candidatus Acidoferrales bacterium]|nr:ABC transporter permease [Candidatus Acidoferrales bacterium]